MRISVPTEIKSAERRVALTPAGVDDLTGRGHEVVVQSGAGLGAHFADDAYTAAGARIVDDAAEVWAQADMVVKVKEPLPEEHGFLRDGLILFTYLHLAADESLTQAILAAGTTAIAYETVQPDGGGLPLLAPMSEIAGRLSVQEGAHHLLSPAGGRGVLLPGVPGVDRAHVTVIGAGVAGASAARAAVGMGAHVEIFDVNLPRLRYLDEVFDGRLQTNDVDAPGHRRIREALRPRHRLRAHPRQPCPQAGHRTTWSPGWDRGSVLVDIAIDQGGCFEGSRPTTHDAPTFAVHDTLYYCVANMPGAAPVTATRALTNATLPYIGRIADKGWKEALGADVALGRGLNAAAGHLTNAPVAQAFGMDHRDVAEALAG